MDDQHAIPAQELRRESVQAITGIMSPGGIDKGIATVQRCIAAARTTSDPVERELDLQHARDIIPNLKDFGRITTPPITRDQRRQLRNLERQMQRTKAPSKC